MWASPEPLRLTSLSPWRAWTDSGKLSALRENGLEWKINNAVAVYDSGHDAIGIYEYLMDSHIKPIIALNPRSGTHPSPTPTGTARKVDENGVPICPGGMLMRRIGFDTKRHRVYYGCPVKRPTHRKNEGYIYINHLDECPLGVLCQPETKHGLVIYIRPVLAKAGNYWWPRPALAYAGAVSANSQSKSQIQEAHEPQNRMRMRTIKLHKKEVYGLGNRPCRSAAHFLVRLYLVSIIEHAKAWLAEDRKRLRPKALDDPAALMSVGAG
jgi:hypothetical protein